MYTYGTWSKILSKYIPETQHVKTLNLALYIYHEYLLGRKVIYS